MIQCLLQRLGAGPAAFVALALLGGTPAAWAQPSSAATTTRPTTLAPKAKAATSAATPAASASAPRAATERRLIEDDQVRIEETHVRGQLQRVTVAPKGSTLKPYEINVGTGGRDPSQDKSSAGQRVWSLLRF